MRADVHSYLERQEADMKVVIINPASPEKATSPQEVVSTVTTKGESADGKKPEDELHDFLVADAGKSLIAFRV